MSRDNVFDLRSRLVDQAPKPADGPPAITFDFEGDGPVVFRDMAALDELITDALASRDGRLAAIEALIPRFEADYGIDSSPVARLRAVLHSDPSERV